MANEWNLSAREGELLAKLGEVGNIKRAALDLGISHRTAEQHLYNIRRQMGVNHTMLAVLAWDREVHRLQVKEKTWHPSTK